MHGTCSILAGSHLGDEHVQVIVSLQGPNAHRAKVVRQWSMIIEVGRD